METMSVLSVSNQYLGVTCSSVLLFPSKYMKNSEAAVHSCIYYAIRHLLQISL